MQELQNVLSVTDDDYLVALANKGILKRSYKDLETAEISAEYTDSAAEVTVLGEKCTITVPLAESKCTCPSRSICRHIITSILWLKNNLSDNITSDSGENQQT
ncbi:MAG: SWIM zinc finger family protein, partial [Acutalibacteraceae bacterium]